MTNPVPAGQTYHHKFPLDDTFYGMDPEDSQFLKERTGIFDDSALKEHIMNVAKNGYVVHPYPCIRRFNFTRLNVFRHLAYQALLKLGRERPGAIYLELGCAFGNDTRKVFSDGWPAENMVATDIVPEFWQLGFQLFKDSPDIFPVHFVTGDITDSTFLSPALNVAFPPFTPTKIDLANVANLTELTHHCSAIYASLFFHLFLEDQQLFLAHSLASLLSPEPGSMIFGKHLAKPGDKGYRHRAIGGSNDGPLDGKEGRGYAMFCHSPTSWKELWEGIFGVGKVRLEATLEEIVRDEYKREIEEMRDMRFYVMEWCVTRL